MRRPTEYITKKGMAKQPQPKGRLRGTPGPGGALIRYESTALVLASVRARRLDAPSKQRAGGQHAT